jgi:transaldolase
MAVVLRSVVPSVSKLKVKIFADGADMPAMLKMRENQWISGFTTNPTLMRKSGVEDYGAFAKEVLSAIKDLPISFEVIADDEAEMERQGRRIAQWGSNVYVKIPITNTQGVSTAPLIRRLTLDGVKLNVTAIMTLEQVKVATKALTGGAPSVVSVFAGRIADTGRDPMPIMRESVAVAAPQPQIEVLWASPRELLNVFHADQCGVHIITATSDVLAKLALVGKDLDAYSLDTVKMFRSDALQAGLSL